MDRHTLPLSRLALGIALAAAPALSLAAACSTSQTFTVDRTDDVTADDGQTTLREAIQAAAANATCNRSEADVIAFNLPGTATKTITLAATLSIMNDSVIINGDSTGGGIKLQTTDTAATMLHYYTSGNHVLELHNVGLDGQNAEVTGTALMAGLTAYGGLVLEDVGVSGFNSGYSSVTNISNGTDVEIRDSVFAFNSGYGGGLYVINAYGGTIDIERTFVAENTASGGSAGGGMHLYGYTNLPTVTITDSSIVDNSSTNVGGGISSYGVNLNLRNSTVSGNSAPYGGGVFLQGSGTIQMVASTITNNTASAYGGGVYGYESNPLTGAGMVISGNTSDGGELYGVTNSIDAASSFIDDGDPGLKPLAFNGDGLPSHMPRADSPLVNALSSPYAGMPEEDQAGRSRPQGAGIDIGAVEYVEGEDEEDTLLGNAGFGLLGLLALLGLRRRR